MSFWAGPGGSVVVSPGVGAKTLQLHKHTVRKTAKLAENNHSGVTASNFEFVLAHYEWTIEIPWDDENLPDTDVGLEEGAKVAIQFMDASSGKFATLTDTSVESLEETYVTDEGVLVAVISGKGGTLTRQVT
jgi:hypothetical protein